VGRRRMTFLLSTSILSFIQKMLNSSGVCIIPFLQLCQWGTQSLGILKAIDGGLACPKRIDLCASKGTANPSVFLNKWSYSIKKCIEHRTKDASTELDIKDAERFLHCSDSSFNEIGKALKKEAAAQVEYAKRMSKLATSLPTESINVITPKSGPSPKSFFLIAQELYLNNPTFNKSILTAGDPNDKSH
jgi:hypothetical protein